MKIKSKLAALGTAAVLTGTCLIGLAAPAQAATSGVDVYGYCKSQFNFKPAVGTTVNPSNAYSWRCTYFGIPLSYGIDMNAACRFTTGRYWAYAGLRDSRNAYTWYCVY
ncbi:hypothetical protein [Arthrobacter oryzae]|uniref:hypothetical protein n=1 Tax=Arthrobacter oryzae TaxID=409290 RepID=UPI0028661C02|nr:hypothetical protein [Arthrobacter oryzae]MDR6508066.1 hypothetical protein [Arthrobacter oryzae]